MNTSCTSSQHWFVVTLAMVVLAAAIGQPASAQSTGVTQVEEDWELTIGTPSATSDAPQVTTMIAPLGDVDGLHATFVVNHHDMPSFVAGGLQLQVWDGQRLLVSKRFPNQAVLTQPGEVIRWTQVMRMTSEGLVFEVIKGSSNTWGPFGDEGTLKATVNVPLASLSGYNPELSVHESGVSYAGNRVQSLVLKKIRVQTAAGNIVEDDQPHVVHSLPQ